MARAVVADADAEALPGATPPAGTALTSTRGPLVVGVVVLVAVLVVRVVAIVDVLASGVDQFSSILGGDTRRYLAILTTPGTPYRDFPVEYPPVVLGFTDLIQAGDVYGTALRLAVSQLALELVAAGALAWAWGRRTALAYLVLGTPMVLFPFPYLRIDLVPVALAVVGLALAKRRWPALGGGVLGLALLAKVWPVVTVPALLLRRRWRALASTVGVVGIGLVAWVLWAGAEGPWQVLTFRGADGWQIESVFGILVHLADPAATVVEQGAWRTGAPVPAIARYGLPVLGLVVAGVAWLLAERRRRAGDARTEVLVDAWAPLAGVLALLVCSTIISPQYVLWATPFAAIAVADPAFGVVRGTRRPAAGPGSGWSGTWAWARASARGVTWGRAPLALGLGFLAVGGLSGLGLAEISPLVRGEAWAGLVVVARNVGLVALLGLCLAVLARRGPAPDRAAADQARADQATPTATMARMSETDATRSIDDVSSGMP